MRKKAIIFGITGQTGSYLARLLIKKNYLVYGTRRRTSTFPLDTSKLEEVIDFNKHINKDLFLQYGDVTDISLVNNLIQTINPDEIYNLSAQSFVKVSFEMPYYTTETNSLGLLNIIESMRSLKQRNKNKIIKLYQASTSEMFGNVKKNTKINEQTPMIPVSPYGLSKLYSYHLVKIYREAYGLFLSNGILFNHESPLRTEHFVTKKITKGLSRIYYNLQKDLALGNLDAMRDWGHADDYARAIHSILSLSKPTDLIVSRGKSYSVRDFIKECFKFLNIEVKFVGKKLNERVVDKNGKTWIKISKEYFRPLEIDYLNGDSKNFKKLIPKFKFNYDFKNLVREMMEYDMEKAKKYLSSKNLDK